MTFPIPEGFSVRSATMDDTRSLTDFMRFCQQAEYGFAIADEDGTSSLWTAPEVDLSQDTWLVFSSEGQIVASMHLIHENHIKMSINLKIYPEHEALRLETWLLQQGEVRARQFIPRVRADARVSLNSSCSGPTRSYRQALQQAGFMYVRSNLRMEIEMSVPPPVAVWPEGITPRPFTGEMAQAVHEADEGGFQDHWGYMPIAFETFQHQFIEHPQFDPTLWFLACEGEKIVGSALCACSEGTGEVNGLSVLRPWRKRGLGLALLYTAFGEFYRRGENKVILWVDAQSLTGATRLYERAGMHITRQFDQYEKELRTGLELSTQKLGE